MTLSDRIKNHSKYNYRNFIEIKRNIIEILTSSIYKITIINDQSSVRFAVMKQQQLQGIYIISYEPISNFVMILGKFKPYFTEFMYR